MRPWILALFVLAVSTICWAQGAKDDLNQLTPDDRELLIKTVNLVDNGLTEAALTDFDYLAKKYPDNYLVQYERAYDLYMLQRYDEVIALQKFFLKNKSATERTYQLIGNAYDLSGNRKQAEKTYKKGLKRFPDSGSLYLELGNLCMSDNEYQKALAYYNDGILAQPNFASNYYRASFLYFGSEAGKVWGLVYAEAAILLAPSNEERHEEMANMIIDCLKESIHFDYGSESSLSVKLVPARDIQFDAKTSEAYVSFPGIYEAALIRPLTKLFSEKKPFDCSIAQLIDIRKGAVEAYYSVTDGLYGDSMYLLEFQRKVIEAGHWDAYNYYLFMMSYPDEFDQWYDTNSEKLDAFIEWYNQAPFTLGDGRSVDPMQILNSHSPLNIFQTLMIQADLLPSTPDKEQP